MLQVSYNTSDIAIAGACSPLLRSGRRLRHQLASILIPDIYVNNETLISMIIYAIQLLLQANYMRNRDFTHRKFSLLQLHFCQSDD